MIRLIRDLMMHRHDHKWSGWENRVALQKEQSILGKVTLTRPFRFCEKCGLAQEKYGSVQIETINPNVTIMGVTTPDTLVFPEGLLEGPGLDDFPPLLEQEDNGCN